MTRGGSGLTHRRWEWVNAYMRTWNATAASRAVGYKHPKPAGHNLLKNPVIQEEIKRRMSATEMEVGEVLYRFAEQARANIGDFLEQDEDTGKIQINWQAVKERGHLIKAVRHTKLGPTIELHDAQKALELIGRSLGMFVDKVDLKNTQTGDITVRFVANDGRDDQVVPPTPTGGIVTSGGIAELAERAEQSRTSDS